MIASRTDLDFHISFRCRNSAHTRQVTDRHIVFLRNPDDRRRIARQSDIPAKVASLLSPCALDLSIDRTVRGGNFVKAIGENRFHHQFLETDCIGSAFDAGQVFVVPDQQATSHGWQNSWPDQPYRRSKVPRWLSHRS